MSAPQLDKILLPFLAARSITCSLLLRRFADLAITAVRSPPFLRHTKHTTRGEDDAKFSYVVIRRGTRPSSGLLQAQPHADFTIAEESLEALLKQAVQDESSELAIETVEPEPATPEGVELAWPRLVAPPLKRSGHVILEVCTASGM